MIKWSDKGLAFRALMIELQAQIDTSELLLRRGSLVTYDAPAFNMSVFHTKKPCGTVGCAMGWAHEKLEPMAENESFRGYLNRVLLIDPVDADTAAAIVYWLFDGAWASIAPSPVDVVRRFDWLSASPDNLVKLTTTSLGLQGFWEEEGLANGQVV